MNVISQKPIGKSASQGNRLCLMLLKAPEYEDKKIGHRIWQELYFGLNKMKSQASSLALFN